MINISTNHHLNSCLPLILGSVVRFLAPPAINWRVLLQNSRQVSPGWSGEAVIMILQLLLLIKTWKKFWQMDLVFRSNSSREIFLHRCRNINTEPLRLSCRWPEMPRCGRTGPTRRPCLILLTYYQDGDDRGRDVVETPEERHSPAVPSYPIQPWSRGEAFLRVKEVSGRSKRGGGRCVAAAVEGGRGERKRDGRHWFCLVFPTLQRLFKHSDSSSEPSDVYAPSHHGNTEHNPVHEIMRPATPKIRSRTKSWHGKHVFGNACCGFEKKNNVCLSLLE